MLGRDPTAVTMARFSGRLHTAALTQQPDAAYDLDDPTAAPTSVPVTYPCEGLAFTYALRDVDGTRIVTGDYRVVLLRGSLAVTPAPGDLISIPPPGSQAPANARVVRVEAMTEAQITLQVRS